MNLTELANLPNCSVFALYNSKKNKVQLMYAKNTLTKLAKTIDELRNNTHSNKELCNDLDDLEFVLLETYPDELTCRELMNYWFDYVVNEEGMELYSKRNYLSYRPKVTVSVFSYDYLNPDRVDRVYVELVNTRGKGFVVGVFDNVPDAEEFKKIYLDSQKFVMPVYATNKLTKAFMRRT